MDCADLIGANPIERCVNSENSEAEIVIGPIIERVCREQERGVTWLARQIHCDRRNIYHIFRKKSIDTHLLLMISKTLRFDFFAIFSSAIAHGDTAEETV